MNLVLIALTNCAATLVALSIVCRGLARRDQMSTMMRIVWMMTSGLLFGGVAMVFRWTTVQSSEAVGWTALLAMMAGAAWPAWMLSTRPR
jgi:hypothetical protein